MTHHWKKILTRVFFLFVIVGIVYATVREREKNGRSDPAPGPAADGLGPVVVYYFHGYQRCSACVRTEKMLRAAVKEAFPAEMKEGKVAFRNVNVEDPANADLVERFHVTARRPVISDEQHGPGPWEELMRSPRSAQDLQDMLKTVIGPMLQRRKAGP